MIKSMTAFGRSCRETPFGRLVVEIQSLNRKVLDISFFLPKELNRHEIELRKWVSATIDRGQISIRIILKSEGILNTKLSELKESKTAWEKIASELGYDVKSTITLSFLVEQLPYLSQNEDAEKEEQMKDLLKEGIEIALKELIAMKEKEGESLAADITSRLSALSAQIEKVEDFSHSSVEKYKEKITERMEVFQKAGEEVDDRILREIALYAEKLDVSEEQTRLKSHINQFQQLMATSQKSVGKTLDFLTQELNREVNTLASKSADAELSQLAVMMKSEIEKIREQIQNIE